ncbi:hypothetical protein [Mongoliibacter ruber]|uniref:Uncharacterized protein n=1 Tax=Mongoliibacter ruber TaxID=1750599 RepID=A0A2T0WV71_9BACT|nr:hypothetical protein [Mongoliibacter ruber]PRY90569.1 hypothetical protein CLW00_101232 [Mongoliibacter ruber]
MTQQEFEIFEEIEKLTGVTSDEPKEKTRAGQFLDKVFALFRKLSKGKLTETLLRIFPIILARVGKIESQASEIQKTLDEIKNMK